MALLKLQVCLAGTGLAVFFPLSLSMSQNCKELPKHQAGGLLELPGLKLGVNDSTPSWQTAMGGIQRLTGLAISIGDLDDGSEGTFSSTVMTPNGRREGSEGSWGIKGQGCHWNRPQKAKEMAWRWSRELQQGQVQGLTGLNSPHRG